MNTPLALTVTNRLSELERVSRIVADFGKQHGLPAKAIFEVNLALDEVLTNVISYSHDDGGEHKISVRLSFTPPELTVEVEDDGRPFNPLAVTEPNVNQPLEDRAIGGLGVHLVRQVMNRLEYRRQQGKNVLVMRKSIVGG